MDEKKQYIWGVVLKKKRTLEVTAPAANIDRGVISCYSHHACEVSDIELLNQILWYVFLSNHSCYALSRSHPARSGKDCR